MNNENDKIKPIQFIRELCKGKTEDELVEAEDNFVGFLFAIKEIADRLELEGKTLSDFEY